MFHVPNKDRIKKGPYKSDDSVGNNGAFHITPYPGKEFYCIASDGMEWEHVSVHINEKRCPTWSEMCKIKNIFWDEEDIVVQFHPKKSEYINNHSYVLHLWRKIGSEFETPPTELIGIK